MFQCARLNVVKSALEMGKMMKTWLGRKLNAFIDVITV